MPTTGGDDVGGGSGFDVGVYRAVGCIGQGAYGILCHRCQWKVGCHQEDQAGTESAEIAKRTYREIRLLKLLQHENIIHALDLYLGEEHDDIYLVTELMSGSLEQIMQSNILDNDCIEYFTWQILCGIKYIHSANVIHRDIKPANLLINTATNNIKICDFGFARTRGEFMTGYVSTRVYRAPEIMLSWQNYGQEIDLWSVGCILAEMSTGAQLFPARDSVHHLSLITELLGSPPEDLVQRIEGERTLAYIRMLPTRQAVPFETKFPNASADAIDLMRRLLCFSPSERITAKDALAHPLLYDYHCEENEPIANAELNCQWAVLEENKTCGHWREMIYDEINEFRQSR